jgi:DNA-binding transcriptional regulator LsrR (DeoR family)
MDDDLLVRIAWQYYIEGLTQQEIANRTHLSRPKVARLLKQARQKGVVEFQIKGTITEHLDLEWQLRSQFGLKDARVIPTPSNVDETRRELGRATAVYLREIFEPRMKIGLGMGRTLAEIPNFVSPSVETNCEIVEMVGGASRTDVGGDTYNISWRLAERLGGVAHHLNTPVVVQEKEMRDVLMKDQQIISALQKAVQCDLALVGIGRLSEEMPLSLLGYCDDATLKQLQAKGAVGDILGHFFDIEGYPVITTIEDRLVGLTANQLKRIPVVCGIAGGIKKTEAMLGALRGRYLNILITDGQTASQILEISNRT